MCKALHNVNRTNNKKMACDERRPIPRLAYVSCLFVPRLAELLVCLDTRGIFPHVAPSSVIHDKTRHRETGSFPFKIKKKIETKEKPRPRQKYGLYGPNFENMDFLWT